MGGEPSGHIICLDSAPTGDAIIAALKFLDSIKEKGFSIDKSLNDFKKFPQTLINLKVDSPNRIIMDDKFWAKVTEIEAKLGTRNTKKNRLLSEFASLNKKVTGLSVVAELVGLNAREKLKMEIVSQIKL